MMSAIKVLLVRFVFFTVFLSSCAMADVSLPRLISDGVVLQRDSINIIWGWASPGEKVVVKFDDRVVATTVSSGEQWSISLPEQPAGGTHKIEIIGYNHITINNVIFGDVWLASGQSNMQLPMARVKVKYPQAFLQTNFANIRQFVVPGKYDFIATHNDVDSGHWQQLDRDTLKDFSAVAYFFAKNIHHQYQVPIGIINSSYGGSPAEAWMSEAALKQYPHYLEKIAKYRQTGYLDNLIASDKRRSDDWYHALNANDLGLVNVKKPWYQLDYDASHWSTIELPSFWQDQGIAVNNGAMWFKKAIELTQAEANLPATLSLGRIVDADIVYVNGIKVGNTTYQYPPRRYTVGENILKPGKNIITVRVISNSGKGGFVKEKPYFLHIGQRKIALQGQWQYNVGTPALPLAAPEFQSYGQPLGFYNAMLAPLLKTTIKGVIWYQGESNTNRPTENQHLFPAMIQDWRKQFSQGDFPFIYVQLANFLKAKPQPVESNWAATRDAQRTALSEPNTAMVVAIDVGEWNDIHPLDKKSLGDRLALAARKLAYHDDIVYSGPLFTAMEVIGSEAIVTFVHCGSGLTHHGDKLAGFAIADKSGNFVWANAAIVNNKIKVWHPDITTPISVRYAWADNPVNANLFNEEGLPASPFQASINEQSLVAVQ